MECLKEASRCKRHKAVKVLINTNPILPGRIHYAKFAKIRLKSRPEFGIIVTTSQALSLNLVEIGAGSLSIGLHNLKMIKILI